MKIIQVIETIPITVNAGQFKSEQTENVNKSNSTVVAFRATALKNTTENAQDDLKQFVLPKNTRIIGKNKEGRNCGGKNMSDLNRQLKLFLTVYVH